MTATRQDWSRALEQAQLRGPLTDQHGAPLSSQRLRAARRRAWGSKGTGGEVEDEACAALRAESAKFLLGRCCYCGLPRRTHR